jgi:DNA-binding NarL/FixJ family response regulator
MNRQTVLLADDHPTILEGLRRILSGPELEIAGAVHDGLELIRSAAELRPDLIVADISMPRLNGLDAIKQIRKVDKHVKFIVLTMHPDVSYAVEALSAGVAGYVLKTSAGNELREAVREALRGGTYVAKAIAEKVRDELSSRRQRKAAGALTPRQREILQMLAEGRSAKQIAAAVHISPRTVEFHKYRIMKALGAGTAAELVRHAIRQGLVT